MRRCPLCSLIKDNKKSNWQEKCCFLFRFHFELVKQLNSMEAVEAIDGIGGDVISAHGAHLILTFHS